MAVADQADMAQLPDTPDGQPCVLPTLCQASPQQSEPVQRSSARQANRRTFKRMLAQRQQEELEYAEYERAAEARMRHGPRPAPHTAQPAAAPAAAAGCTVDADGTVVVKKRRGRPPKPRPPEPPKPFLMGESCVCTTWLCACSTLPGCVLAIPTEQPLLLWAVTVPSRLACCSTGCNIFATSWPYACRVTPG